MLNPGVVIGSNTRNGFCQRFFSWHECVLTKNAGCLWPFVFCFWCFWYNLGVVIFVMLVRNFEYIHLVCFCVLFHVFLHELCAILQSFSLIFWRAHLLKRDGWFGDCLCLFDCSIFCIQLSVIIVLRLERVFVNFLIFFLCVLNLLMSCFLLNCFCFWRKWLMPAWAQYYCSGVCRLMLCLDAFFRVWFMFIRVFTLSFLCTFCVFWFWLANSSFWRVFWQDWIWLCGDVFCCPVGVSCCTSVVTKYDAFLVDFFCHCLCFLLILTCLRVVQNPNLLFRYWDVLHPYFLPVR